MATLISRFGGVPLVAPSVRERPLDDNSEAFRWAERLFAGEFDMVVFMTGVGLGYLRDAVLTRHSADRLREALRAVTVVCRGPKPLGILHELGVQPQIRIPEPNTWREIVPLVAERPERRISVQEYGTSNTEFLAALRALGAEVSAVSVYRWELPEDVAPLLQATRRVARRECDVVVFTTSIQLVHLLQVAGAMELSDQVLKALAEDLVIASVGPIMNAALAERGLVPDIVPAHPKMGALVRAAAEEAAQILARKRALRAT